MAECGLGLGASGCGTRREFTSLCGEIYVTQGPMPGALCEWQIALPAGNLVNLTFTQFSLPDLSAGKLSIIPVV